MATKNTTAPRLEVRGIRKTFGQNAVLKGINLSVDAGEVGLASAWTAVESTEARPPRTQGEIVKDEDGSGATALVGFLASKKFI